jgi:catalase (peroxidase I)
LDLNLSLNVYDTRSTSHNMFMNPTRNVVACYVGSTSRCITTSSFTAQSAHSLQHGKNRFLAYAVASIVAVGIVCFQPAQSASSKLLDTKKAKSDIVAAIEADDDKRSDGTSIGPTLVRLAWHASGTYSCFDKTGGSNGASQRFSPESDWGANAGLKVARDFVEIIKKKNNISTADAWTLAGGEKCA